MEFNYLVVVAVLSLISCLVSISNRSWNFFNASLVLLVFSVMGYVWRLIP